MLKANMSSEEVDALNSHITLLSHRVLGNKSLQNPFPLFSYEFSDVGIF